ncbi:MAG: hypothetical protein FWD64_05230 [Acidobacteriaceae bacterium]|nr:hypothetical protein [Acidobacteriaceae bacterium]
MATDPKKSAKALKKIQDIQCCYPSSERTTMKYPLYAVCAAIALTFYPVIDATAQKNDKTYKHASQYQVAVLDQNLRVATGEDVTAGKTSTDSKLDAGGQGIHLLHTDAGDYRVEAPVNTGRSLLSAMASDRYHPAVTVHNKWFLDHVQPGTKVLFASQCAAPKKKHPNDTVRCTFWFPNPDSTTHEYMTQGDFTPFQEGDGSNTNKTANALCGTGKLSPSTEAEICDPKPAVAPAPTGSANAEAPVAPTPAPINN